MQSKEAVEIDRAALGTGTRHGNRRPRGVVSLLAVRHDHVQTVDRAALKNSDERLVALRRRGVGHPDKNIRKQSPADKSETGGFEKEASIDHEWFSYCRWNSGEPRISPATVGSCVLSHGPSAGAFRSTIR